jgi:predicted alpha-1,6-mannanase (GH76 family)
MQLLSAKQIRPSRAFIMFAAFSLSSLAFFPLKQAWAVTPVEADTAFNAMNALYWDPVHKLFRKEEHGNTKADFWFGAQLWDTLMDQYDRTGDAAVKQQINDYYDGFTRQYPDWTTNEYNDDIMWWTIACARAFTLTHDQRYLKKSKASFDFVYDHFLDSSMGGGLYWINKRTSKNSCLNSPAVIAAVRLSVLLKDPAYLQKAKDLYAWQKKTLTDGNGKVFDSISFDKPTQRLRTAKFSLTYNQGTFIGAAVLLHDQTRDATYLQDAIKTAQWTKANLCVTDKFILRDEGQGDGGAFKGIFTRYMKRLITDGGQKDFLPWMKTNADTAWHNRRPGDNIMGNDWSAPTGAGIRSQTECSAVSVVLEFADDPPSH